MRARASSVGFVGRASATRIILAAWPSSEPGAGCDRRLLVYLTAEEAAALGNDLAAQTAFQHWILDLASPALLKMLAKKMAAPLDQAGIPLKFAPETGPEFFTRCGWEPEQIHSVMHAAAKIKRLPLFLRLIAMISATRFQPNRPWSGVCLMGRRENNREQKSRRGRVGLPLI